MTLIQNIFVAGFTLCPMMGFAAGSFDVGPPKPTETTEKCADGLIFDLATQTCMTPDKSTNDDNAMMDAVRELAYNERYADARIVLDSLDAGDGMVQTYYGFVERKTGDLEAGHSHYQTALRINPDNILARSYMGQGMVLAGDQAGARAQLTEIRARGGRDTWPETALRLAIRSGIGLSY